MAGHCVMKLADLTLVYQGSDGAKAAAAAVEGTHWAEGPTISAAIFRCAAEIGCIRRGELTPRMGRTVPVPSSLATVAVAAAR
jgi:hypothetical protein